ncbi:MAG: TGS domain-containing protein [Planctomycetaceae bacterium]|nr:TGS domain-containing protein [Planctomycetaceae bacterium]
MPANLTPQYHKAEDAYRRAQTAEERVTCLEEMLRLIPKHKGTTHLQADLKTRLKETRAEVETEKSAGKSTRSFRIPRQGAGTVIVIGAPNAGKSRVLKELTNAVPEVAEYPFTTREPLPGMMPWEDIKIQLIDTPPITESHIEPYVVGFVRSADLVLLCFDGGSDDAPEQTAEVIAQFETRKTRLSRWSGFDEEDYSIVHVKTLLLVTRGDDADASERLAFFHDIRPDVDLTVLQIELTRTDSIDELRNGVFEALGVIRVYTKKPGKPATYDDPYTLPRGGTVEDLAVKVHRDLAETLKHAKVWGQAVQDGQTVGREHVLADRDLVEIHA